MNNTGNEDNVVTVDLSDEKSRDKHIDSLENWHPDFHFIANDLKAIVEQYGEVMKRYREILLTGGDAPDRLFNHVHEEVCLWTYNRLDETTKSVWRDSMK
jgi:ABC-type transport system involved in Fe-S cluster assembly fused permease/ATPase subunit